MKIIVLAAGKGERLMPLTRAKPKSLLDMGNGRTLLEEQLARMTESGVIDECVLVVGYLAQQIEDALQSVSMSPLRTRTLFNPFFSVSNNLASLWLSKSEMDQDFMITNGDCIFPAEIYRDFVQGTVDGVGLCVNRKQRFDDDDMKVSLRDGLIREVSKLIEPANTDAESPGLAIVRGENTRQVFLDRLETLMRRQEMLDRFWLEIFNDLVNTGTPVEPWMFPEGTKWQEVDFHLDLDIVRSVLQLGDL